MPLMIRAAKRIGEIEFSIFSSKTLERQPEMVDDALAAIDEADLVFLYRWSESVWDRIEAKVKEAGEKKPIVSLGSDPSVWLLSTVEPVVVQTCNAYLLSGGEDNYVQLFNFLASEVLKTGCSYSPPKPEPWEGIWHPRAERHFERTEDYLAWYQPKPAPFVGLLTSRSAWLSGDLSVETTLIEELERKGLNVIPAFCYALSDESLGTRSMAGVVEDFFMVDGKPRVDALIKLVFFFLDAARRSHDDQGGALSGVRLLKSMNVPVFEPVSSYYRTVEDWADDGQGLSSEVGWSIAMPEFEGVIEPLIIGGLRKDLDEETGTEVDTRVPIGDRCAKVAARISKWLALRNKPVEERKIAFILHNNPCASVEATVGAGAHLDTLESVSRILHRMKNAGYRVDPPTDGKALIEMIMERKAISEFRWTPVEEIVAKGGALACVEVDRYLEWFEKLSPGVKERVCEAWGNPPGELKDGVPPAMVHEGRIVVTGVRLGNAVVCVQPKRGCAGARCDGQVCKILHDPDVPPPHQYYATYRYLEDEFGADAIVHVGTHGNLEFLPGKSVGLSADCYPDINIGTLPHLYVYNADNPPEGTIAKRRSYATLVDHMQTVLVEGGLYEKLTELDEALAEYEKTRTSDPGRAHVLQHLILEGLEEADLLSTLGPVEGLPFDEVVRRAHDALSLIRTTQIQDGMHIFGDLPREDRLADLIASVMRYDDGEKASLRGVVLELMGIDLAYALEHQGEVHPGFRISYGRILEQSQDHAKAFVKEFLELPRVETQRCWGDEGV
ncbi:MAG: cobaltochelatase subunit CobN [Actinomycetota bacterium]|nr:cobaltochelatase subunit CobN [Actinomycetota bacterium]